MEVVYSFILDKKLTNRGFLIGPICPIYGTGCILIIMLCTDFKAYPLGLFTLAIVIASILEYFTSYYMEKFFKARWWDYSNRKFNINGRICLETMVPFGLIACFVMYILNPFILEILNKIPATYQSIIAVILLIILLIDVSISFNIINNYKKVVKTAITQDDTEDINQYVKNIILERSILSKRLLHAFPRTKVYRIKDIIKKD